jgi:hypothetical protein
MSISNLSSLNVDQGDLKSCAQCITEGAAASLTQVQGKLMRTLWGGWWAMDEENDGWAGLADSKDRGEK